MTINQHFCNEGVVYYDSLHSAVEDINSSVKHFGMTGCPKVAVVWGQDSRPVVRLMEDVTEFTVIEVAKNLVLDLGGKCLRFAEPGYLKFGVGTDCAILGKAEGSAIRKSVSNQSDTCYLVYTFGTKLTIHGGCYSMEGTAAKGMVCVRVANTCTKLEMDDCCVCAVNHGESDAASAYAVLTEAAQTAVHQCNLQSEAVKSTGALRGSNRVIVDHCILKSDSKATYGRAIYIQSGNVSISNNTMHVYGGYEAYGIDQHGGFLEARENAVYTHSTRLRTSCVHTYFTTSAITNCQLRAFSDNSTANCVYNYEGVMDVSDCDLLAESTTGTAFAVEDNKYVGEDYRITTTLRDSEIKAVSHEGDAMGVNAYYGLFLVENCEIEAINHGDALSNAYGIYVDSCAEVEVVDTSIMADAPNTREDDWLTSVGVLNRGIAIVKNVTASGTHSGIQNCDEGQLYVVGGEYDGFNLGGVQLAHGPKGNAFINGATIRGGGYHGVLCTKKQLKEELAHKKMGALCVGRCSGGSTYVDGCVIDDSKTNAPIVILGDSGEENNTLNISNTTLSNVGEKKVRVDGDTPCLNIGTGCNITAAALRYTDSEGTEQDYVQQDRAAFTDGFYHRVSPYRYCTEQDMELLAAAQGNE